MGDIEGENSTDGRRPEAAIHFSLDEVLLMRREIELLVVCGFGGHALCSFSNATGSAMSLRTPR